MAPEYIALTFASVSAPQGQERKPPTTLTQKFLRYIQTPSGARFRLLTGFNSSLTFENHVPIWSSFGSCTIARTIRSRRPGHMMSSASNRATRLPLVNGYSELKMLYVP